MFISIMSRALLPQDTGCLSDESFRWILIPEIFTNILRHLKRKDRLNLRLCSREVEEAVAQSDLYIDGYPGLSILYLSRRSRVFKVHFGLKSKRETLRLKKHFEDADMEEVARVRERIFSRIYTNYVDIRNIDYNVVSVTLVERILNVSSRNKK
ncbi:hypothetical protein PENTCL1PPCAC_15787 [Pristionchus entomophagus]|uniref:F-box domain-containing protein n=1 Tax=Pristionchus entomophagus TaxID=358040 RepID=A0AAV5TH27_9BILA|nr:hypothetical protein PENTCL1PPCAC_15787 [Pristionchus entomophagus]